MATAFHRIFADNALSNFGTVEVTAEPSHDALKQVLKMPFIRRLTIELVRPNPDDHGGFEQDLLKKLEVQHATTMEITLSANKDDQLVLSQETQSIARVAALNGYVRASGRDADGLSITRSTKDIPLIERAIYNSDLQTSNDALFQAAVRLHASRSS